MTNLNEYREEFLDHLPSEVLRLISRCTSLPRVEPDGTSACPHSEAAYYAKEEAAIRVKELRDTRLEKIEKLKQEIEQTQSTSAEPWWATDDDKCAGSPSFERYCEQLWEKEKEIKEQVRQLKDSIARVRVEIGVIDEVLARAAQKSFPRTPMSYGKPPGTKVVLDLAGDDARMARKFLGG